MASNGSTWRFPRHFWMANVAELFERAAFYGVAIGLAVYLTRNYDFGDVGANWVGGYFMGFIYLMPSIAGAWADRMGFRRALMLAFALLAAGYFMFGFFGTEAVRGTLGSTGGKVMAVLSLTVILMGGAFVKPIISGTVAKSSDEHNRARAFSIFYQVVNIGSFLGKSFAQPLREHLGLEYISYYSALMGLLGFAVVAVYYKGEGMRGDGRSVKEILVGYLEVLRNGRFLALIIIVAGFWTIQGQLYAAMPKYVFRTVGPHAKPEWLANINPLMVVLLVIPVTHLVRKLRPVTSIAISMIIIAISPLMISLSPVLESLTGRSVSIAGLVFHPITIMLIVGIGLQGLAECFLSPRFLEFASKQAPPGKEGLYMGYAHINVFIAWLFGFGLSGYLLEAFCPDPRKLSDTVRQAYHTAIETGGQLPDAYAHAHYIWYVYAVIGIASLAALLIYRYVTDRFDARGKPVEEKEKVPTEEKPEKPAADVDAAPTIDPRGINPTVLHAVIMVKIIVFLSFLALLKGNPEQLTRWYHVWFYAALALDIAAIGLVYANRNKIAAAVLWVVGICTFPLGLFTILSARLTLKYRPAETQSRG